MFLGSTFYSVNLPYGWKVAATKGFLISGRFGKSSFFLSSFLSYLFSIGFSVNRDFCLYSLAARSDDLSSGRDSKRDLFSGCLLLFWWPLLGGF